MPAPKVIARAIASRPVVAPIVAPAMPLPAYVTPSTTIAQPNLGPDVGPVSLFTKPKPKTTLSAKHLIIIALMIAAYLYL